jgi:hypothetical protein
VSTELSAFDGPERGVCPLCDRDVAGAFFSGVWLPTRGTQHTSSCPNFQTIGEKRPYVSPHFELITDPARLAQLRAIFEGR